MCGHTAVHSMNGKHTQLRHSGTKERNGKEASSPTIKSANGTRQSRRAKREEEKAGEMKGDGLERASREDEKHE